MPLPQPHKFSQRIKATKRPGVGDGQTKFEKRGKQYRGQKLSANYALTFIMGSRIEKSLMGCPKEVDQLLWKRTTRITPKIQAMKLKK